MFDYIYQFFSKTRSRKKMADAIARNATIIDVRTPEEFATGHSKYAVNIPIDKFFDHILSLKSVGNPVIVCCSSGIRSAKAITILRAAGLEGYNAGNWKNISKI